MIAAFAPSDDRRFTARLSVDRKAVLRLGDRIEDIVIEDLTSGGCRFACAGELPLLEPVSIGIAGVGHTPAHLVWSRGRSYGCAFERPLPLEAVTERAPDNIARLAETASRWQSAMEGDEPEIERWPLRARVAVIAGSSAVLWTGIIGLTSLLY